MKVLILGSDGYIGWPLFLHLRNRGHEVTGIDNFSRRVRVEKVHSISATPIANPVERQEIAKDMLRYIDVHVDYQRLITEIDRFRPDHIIHLAEQPSAPWSMRSRWCCLDTIHQNVMSTINVLYAMRSYAPKALLIKLGTMGEYGTPSCNIRENDQDFPLDPGSWYHVSKVHDSQCIKFACKIWDLQVIDIMQSPVYGIRTDETMDDKLITRFDFDEYFGTVLNRFCIQAVAGHPLTVYGMGDQKRGFIALRDSIQCIRLIVENWKYEPGRYTSVNQLTSTHTINELANEVAFQVPDTTISYTKNPRVENERHFYSVTSDILKSIGYKPTANISSEIEIVIEDLHRWKDRFKPYCKNLFPNTTWR